MEHAKLSDGVTFEEIGKDSMKKFLDHTASFPNGFVRILPYNQVSCSILSTRVIL